jgi:gliotoxin/aspirochlorine biosynthesis gamma-glutamylcyclotransferase
MLAQQPVFQAHDSLRYRIGKRLFETFWMRVQRLVQAGIICFRDEHGLVPYWFLVVFDMLLWTMWIYHDLIHAKLWGRGDGL